MKGEKPGAIDISIKKKKRVERGNSPGKESKERGESLT